MEKYNLITCIVQKGKAETIVRDAMGVGAHGATWCNAQGTTWFTGIGESARQKLGIKISPEKEIVYIVAREDETDSIYDAVVETGRLNEKGMGFIFVSRVDRAQGFIDI